jgi:photosystem II stability/assembly factor-like uncharacterized protein
MTGPDVIVNDVFVDPRNSQHVLLATDRSGVLSSADGAASFVETNEGFSGRKVEALLADRANPAHLFAGVVNDKSYGGVFVSGNGGASWEHIGQGLEGRDVFALAQAADGTIVAGTNHGIFALDAGAAAVNTAGPPEPGDVESTPAASAQIWTPRNVIANTLVKTATETVRGKRVNVEKQVKDTVRELEGRVYALDLSGAVWMASTTSGILTSHDLGATWQGGPVMGVANYLSVAARGTTLAAARTDGVVISTDGGLTWMPIGIPRMLTRIHRVQFSGDGTIWLGAREGVYFSHDRGRTWLWIERLPFRDVDDLYYDAGLDEVLVSSRISDQVYAIDPKTLAWRWWQTGYRIGLIRAAGRRLVAASLYDGVLVEPHPAGTEAGQR